MASQPDRILLWSTPRSLSTAFFRAMINRPKTKGLMEPFFDFYYYGSDRISKRFNGIRPIQENCTFLDVKEECEKEYPGYDMVFIKAHAFRFENRMSPEYLPKGFKHTFILRHPRDAVTSFYKAISIGHEGFTYLDPAEVGYKELYQMFQMVTEQLGQEAIIVDTKDLLDHPEEMIHLYCDKVGINFHGNMLNWSTKEEDIEIFRYHGDWFKNLMAGTKFHPYHPKPPIKLPEEYEVAIEESIPFYDKLYQHRLKLDV